MGASRQQAGHPQTMRNILLVFVIFAGLVLAIDATFVEPIRIDVTHSWVEASLARPMRIAHLTDLHTTGIGRPERRLLDLLAAEQPDAIVITGDSLGWGHNAYDHIRPLLSSLHAPLGVWLVRGNWENSYPLRDNYPVHDERAFYSQLGIHFLLNEAAPIRPDVWLVGLDDPSNGTPDLDAAMSAVPKGVYAIAAFHAPEFFDTIAGRVPLVLAGHTHGGQVRLPFVPVFWLPHGSGRFLEGWYGDQGSKMYVSRGIGMSGLPIRFRCRPELSMITVGR